MEFPFKYINSFLIKMEIFREPKLPKELKFPLETQVKITKDEYPEKIQVNLIFRTREPSPFKAYLEMVGLYQYVGSDPESDKPLIEEFVFDIVVPSLIPIFLPILRSNAALMEVHGINYQIPDNYVFSPVEKGDPPVEK